MKINIALFKLLYIKYDLFVNYKSIIKYNIKDFAKYTIKKKRIKIMSLFSILYKDFTSENL